MTSGQLRAAVAHAVLAADPDAARRDREERLASAPTLAADKRLGQIARAWQKQGAAAGVDLRPARAYLALLLSHDVDVPPADLLPGGSASVPGHSHPGPGRAAASAGTVPDPGSVDLGASVPCSA